MKPFFSIVLAALCATFAATPTLAQSKDEVSFARQVLASLQDNSFAARREYCGIIGRSETGALIASRPRKGRRDSCSPRDPREAIAFLASFHTHGAFDPEADAEVPSSDDVRGDMSEGLDGFVSTPGGRLWFIDGQTGVSRQLCGLGCLPTDPTFRPGVWGKIAKRYTLDQLEFREAQ